MLESVLTGLLTFILMVGCATNSSVIIKGDVRDDGRTRIKGVCDKPSVSVPLYKKQPRDREVYEYEVPTD